MERDGARQGKSREMRVVSKMDQKRQEPENCRWRAREERNRENL